MIAQLTTKQRVFVVKQLTQTPSGTVVGNNIEPDFENKIQFHLIPTCVITFVKEGTHWGHPVVNSNAIS